MIPLMKSTFFKEREIKENLAKFILHSKSLSMGEQCELFEEEFAVFQGAKEAVLFNSGGSANLTILQTLKNLGRLKDEDKVGFSALTWSTNVAPIIQMRLRPVPIDCEPTTINVMSSKLKERLKESGLQALFITNVLGFAGDLDNIRQICNENNILLLEDNCEALGTELPAGKTGSFGKMSSFSFYVAHHLSTVEGGMVCTDNKEFAEMLRIVRANGWDRQLTKDQQEKWRRKYNITSEFDAKYTFYDLGYNFKPTEITGFLGRFQLKYLQENIRAREKNYKSLEFVVKTNPDLISLDCSHISFLSNFAFPVLCKNQKKREKYVSLFSKSGIETRPLIAGNIQNQPFYRKYVADLFDLPGTEKISKCGFYFGNYPELNENDITTISNCLKKI